jgi:septum site-determining protein MinD
MKFVSFHSLKGGTGKTTLAANFAAMKALEGKKTCLLDFDFRAPSLNMFFRVKPKFWLNEFLEGKKQITDALTEIKVAGPGKLAVGFANPSVEAMREMMKKDREWEVKALQRILSAKMLLENEGYDLAIFDTSPGIQYASLNALASSNLIVFIMTKDELNREGLDDVVSKIYKPLGTRIGVVLNKALFCVSEGSSNGNGYPDTQTAQFAERTEKQLKCPVWGLVPCLCEVAMEGMTVHALKDPTHPFVNRLTKVFRVIDKNL